MEKQITYIPECGDLEISQDSDYVYMCENNTIYGTIFHCCPNSHGKALVNDISSSFLSEPMNVSDYGMLFGGVQHLVDFMREFENSGEYCEK